MIKDLSTAILIVDDSAATGRIIAGVLRQIGFETVDFVHGASSAIERMRTTSYGLVIADWNMPTMSGLDLLKTIRSDKAFAAIHFIMMTAEASREHVLAAKKAGADAFLVKPFTAQSLKAKLDSILAAPPKADDDDFELIEG